MPVEPRPQAKPRIAWSTHPFVERPLTSLGVLLLLGLILMGVYFWFESIYWVLLSFLILFLSLSAYFVPTVYELYDDRIVVKRFITTQTKRWDQFRRVYPDRNGAFLSPFATPSRLENFRGIFLRIPARKDEIYRFLLEKIGPNDGGAGATGAEEPASPPPPSLAPGDAQKH